MFIYHDRLVHSRTVATVTADQAPEREFAETEALPSPAGPVDADTPARMPPCRPQHRFIQTAWFGGRPIHFNLSAAKRYGDVWQIALLSRKEPFVVTQHPDHVKSLLTAKPDDAPSLTGESPLRPILGPNSVLTSVGARHMRQRKLLLPAFHGEAVQSYVEMIASVAEREIDSWPVGKPFALAPRMQSVTLDVIMSGIFGIDGVPARGTPERRLRETFSMMLRASTNPLYRVVELQNLARREPNAVLGAVLGIVDRQLYALIRARRADPTHGERHDVLSLLLEACDEDGQHLNDKEIRDELMALVLAGHETTANSLAWTFERLVRTPAPYDRLRAAVRGDANGDGEEYVEATIYEGMRMRPVIPMIVRMVKKQWQLGEYVLPPNTPVAMSIVGVHHRPDVYPDPFAFRPERFLGGKPGTYTWIPFGGGIRRCLGASLAMAEQRVVLTAVARRTDLAVAGGTRSERPRQRNVTMIPNHGGRVIVQCKHPS